MILDGGYHPKINDLDHHKMVSCMLVSGLGYRGGIENPHRLTHPDVPMPNGGV